MPAQKIAETRDNLLDMREALSTPEDRIEGAGKLQREAESSYAEQRYALALRTQLTALWLVAPGEPALPRSLADPATPGLAALQPVIGEEEAASTLPADTAEAAAGSQKAVLRLALLLDLANTALRLEDWPVARLACEKVLSLNPRSRAQSLGARPQPQPPAPAPVPAPAPQPKPKPKPKPKPTANNPQPTAHSPQPTAQAQTQGPTPKPKPKNPSPSPNPNPSPSPATGPHQVLARQPGLSLTLTLTLAITLTLTLTLALTLTRCWRASPATRRRAIGWRRRTTAPNPNPHPNPNPYPYPNPNPLP